MMTEQDIVERITAAERIEEVLPFLDRLASYEKETGWTVLVTAFRALAWLGDPILHQRGLELSYTLPVRERDWLQDFLTDWAVQLPPEKRSIIDAEWLSSLEVELLKGTDIQRLEAAMWMAITIGSRTLEIEQQLERLAGLLDAPNPHPQIQDQAIWALTWLGYANESALISLLEQRLQSQDYTLQWLLQSVRFLTPSALIPILLEKYRQQRSEEGSYSSLLWVIAETAQAHPQEADKIWAAIEEGSTPQSIWDIDGAGGVTSKIDSPAILDFFLRRLGSSVPESDDVRRHPHYNVYHRMRSLSCPRQLEAWRQSALRQSDQVISSIRQDACRTSEYGTKWLTENARLKEMAWDIGLRLNLDDILSWFPEALHDADMFVLMKITNLAGYLRVSSAVPALRGLLIKEESEWSLGIAIIQALGNIGTREAFDALIESRIRVGNSAVPQVFADAVANVTLFMSDCIPLLDKIQDDKLDPTTRMALSAALEQVASRQNSFVEPFKQQIITLLSHAEQLPPRAVLYLIGTLGLLEADDSGVELLKQFAGGKGEEVGRALEALARWDRLSDSSDLLVTLGLEAEGEFWKVGGQLDYRGTFTTGLLYTTHPQLFTSAVIKILDTGGYIEALQVIWLLGNMPSGFRNDAVENALVKRIIEKNANRQSESEAVAVLAAIAPERFAREFGYEVCAQWSAAFREVVVVYLGDISEPAVACIAASETLRRFLSDAVPAVRRRAARGLSDQNPDLLHQEAERLLKSPLPYERECGIRAACWVGNDQAFELMSTTARHDTEQSVRKAAREGVDDRRESNSAKHYLEYVLVTGEDVLGSWHYGQALRDCGDDETLRQLEAAAQNRLFSPNKQDWLKSIAKGVESHWDEIERKRNNP